MRETPVLIVGGGPVGLAASILLSRAGVPSLLVERHPGTAIHPKARAIDIRTMEIFRQCGAEDDVRAAGLPHDSVRFVVWTESLAGRELERRSSARLRPGVARIGPVLVRPDAHAGWRARSGAADHQGSAIRHALGSILGRP